MISFEQPNQTEVEPENKWSEMLKRLQERFEGNKRMLACFLALTAYSTSQVQEAQAQIETPPPSIEHVIDEIAQRDPSFSEWTSSKVAECQDLVENKEEAGAIFQIIECSVDANDAQEGYESTSGESLPTSGENISVHSKIVLEDRSNSDFDRASFLSQEFSVSKAENGDWKNISVELPGIGFAYATEEDAKMSALRSAIQYIGTNIAVERKYSNERTSEVSAEGEFSVDETGLTFTRHASSSSNEIQSYDIDIREARDQNGDLIGYEVVSIQFTF